MTDAVRIARLTELAWRVWPQATTVEVFDEVDQTGCQFAGVEVDGQDWIVVERHERALDAVEAALQVLAGHAVHEAANKAAEEWGGRAEVTIVQEADAAEWVEQLATGWRCDADVLRATRSPLGWSWYDELADRLDRCATELRKAAKAQP